MQENKASRLFLISSVILGALAAVVSFAYLNQATASDRGPKVHVIVARHDLRENAALDPERDFDEIEIPARMTQLADRSLKPEVKAAYKGQRVNRTILAGTPIMLADLIAGANFELKGDSRAMAVKAKGAQKLSGLLIPGDYVKMFVEVPSVGFRPSTGPADPAVFHAQVVEILPEPVKVLAVGARLAREREQVSLGDQYQMPEESESQQTVTLDVTEEQAKTILERTGIGNASLPVMFVLCPPMPATPK